MSEEGQTSVEKCVREALTAIISDLESAILQLNSFPLQEGKYSLNIRYSCLTRLFLPITFQSLQFQDEEELFLKMFSDRIIEHCNELLVE